jgi:replicative DNA helicase
MPRFFVISAGNSKDPLKTESCTSKVDSQRMRTGKLEDDDWKKIARTLGPLSEAPIYIDDTPGISMMEIRAKCRRLKLEKNLGLVIIDYLQLMQGRGKNDNRQQEISEISRSLKILAKEIMRVLLHFRT